MSEEKKKKSTRKAEECQAPAISRRKFAMGAAAIIGTYSGTDASTRVDFSAPPAPPAAQSWNLEKSNDVLEILDERHVTDIDLRQVIEYAENTGEKLYQPDTDRVLAKLRIGEVYFYAEYSPVETGYRIHTAYTHRFLLEGDTQ
jgi:hypothetical protein